MALCIHDVSDTPLGDVNTARVRDTDPHSNKPNKMLFSDESEYQVDESERSLLETLLIEDDKNKVAWYFKDDKADCKIKPSTSSSLEQSLKVLIAFFALKVSGTDKVEFALEH